jgi:hypothetical protein
VVTGLRVGEGFIHRQSLESDDHDHDPGDRVSVFSTWRVARRFHRLQNGGFAFPLLTARVLTAVQPSSSSLTSNFSLLTTGAKSVSTVSSTRVAEEEVEHD